MTDNVLVFCFENVAFRECILLFLLRDFFSSFFPNESSPVSTSIVPTAIATSYA